ncbi:MAG: contractile injection system tape measure protein [Bacteroidota bacterium]
MNEAVHRVFRLSLDLSLPAGEEAKAVQDRISQLLKIQLTDQLNRLLSEFDDPNVQLQIDQLQLDLGSMPIDDLEREIPPRLDKEFRELFASVRRQHPIIRQQQQKSLPSSLEVFRYYLLKGSLPWWASKLVPKSILDLFYQLIQTNSVLLRQSLFELLGQEWPRQRIIKDFEDEDLNEMVRLLERVNAKLIIAYNQELEWQHDQSPILPLRRREFRRLRWEVILRYLHEEKGSEFNQRSFLKRLIYGLAASGGGQYEALIKQLEELALSVKPSHSQSHSLLKNIVVLAKEERSGKDSSYAPPQSKTARQLLRGLTHRQRQTAEQYLPFVEGQTETWLPETPPTVGLLLIKRLWDFDRDKAIGLIQRLALIGKPARPLLQSLPAEIIRDTLAELHPALHPACWHLRHDLIQMAKHKLLGHWSAQEMTQLIDQHYLDFLSLTAGTGFGMLALLKSLLYKMADSSNSSYRQLLVRLIHSIPKARQSWTFQSELIRYLQQLSREKKWAQLELAAILSTDFPQEAPLDWADLSDVDQYFRQGILPNGKSLSSLRLSLKQLLQESPDLLRRWFRQIIKHKDARKRFFLFFGSEQSIQFLNLLETKAGTYADSLLKIMQNTAAYAQLLAGRKAAIYWQVAAQQLLAEDQKGFHIRHFVLAIVENINRGEGIDTVLWLDQLKDQPIKPDLPEVRLLRSILYAEAIRLSPEDPPHSPEVQMPSSDFSRMGAQELIKWMEYQLTLPSQQVKRQQLRALSRHILRLPLQEKHKFWQLLSDQKITKLLGQLTGPDELARLMDIAQLVQQMERRKEQGLQRFFPVELSSLLLDALLNDRGSLSNQKAFIAKLLKDWARAHNRQYEEVIRLLWPIIWELQPAFRHHRSLQVFTDVFREELGMEKLMELIPAPSGRMSRTMEEEKPYRKLWDRDKIVWKMEETWIVHNAGLAILWPYFKILFERSGLMEDSEFVNTDAQQKAVLLLEYLISQQIDPEESQLVFNKVLCGYPLAAPIDVDYTIDEATQELCSGLLQAVVNHWSIIGDTSVESFRETFLLREGTLGLASDHWNLEVSPKAFDVLLRELPWGINPINLSWMDKIVKVEWE